MFTLKVLILKRFFVNNKPSLLFIISIVCLSIGGLISTDIFLPTLGDMRQ